MKRIIIAIGLILAYLVLTGGATLEDAPEGVAMTAQFVGDSVTLELSWTPPERTARQTPITGWEWRFVSGEAPLASGESPADHRSVEHTMAVSCDNTPVNVTGGVRALGEFSAPAAWGVSATVRITCDNSPPGPPTVQLDTIPRDTISNLDSLVLLPVELGTTGWNRDEQSLHFVALGDSVTMCAFAYSGEAGHLLPRGQNVVTLDPTMANASGDVYGELIVDGDALVVRDAPPEDGACWYVISVALGHGDVTLCSTDCGAAVAGFSLRFLPHWMRGPLAIAGILLLVWSFWQDWKKRRVRSS